MTRLRNAICATLAISLAGVGILYGQSKQAAAPALTPEKYASSTEWPTYGHDAGGMRFSPLKEITPSGLRSKVVAG